MRILYSGVLLVLLQLRSPLSRSCYYYFCLKTESVFLSFSGLYSLQDDEFNPCPRCPCRQRRIKACEQHKHLKLTEYFGVVEVGDISSNELGQSSTNHKPPSNWKQIWCLRCPQERAFSSARMNSIHEKSSSGGVFCRLIWKLCVCIEG